MASAYSQDLRDRVIDAVIRGGMSRRAAAARFAVGNSSAIKSVQRFERSGSRAASRMADTSVRNSSRIENFSKRSRGDESDITLKALCQPVASGSSAGSKPTPR